MKNEYKSCLELLCIALPFIAIVIACYVIEYFIDRKLSKDESKECDCELKGKGCLKCCERE